MTEPEWREVETRLERRWRLECEKLRARPSKPFAYKPRTFEQVMWNIAKARKKTLKG